MRFNFFCCHVNFWGYFLTSRQKQILSKLSIKLIIKWVMNLFVIFSRKSSSVTMVTSWIFKKFRNVIFQKIQNKYIHFTGAVYNQCNYKVTYSSIICENPFNGHDVKSWKLNYQINFSKKFLKYFVIVHTKLHDLTAKIQVMNLFLCPYI